MDTFPELEVGVPWESILRIQDSIKEVSVKKSKIIPGPRTNYGFIAHSLLFKPNIVLFA